jgi:putative ABC transport system permease protein
VRHFAAISLKTALRALRSSRGGALASALTLSLGIGFTTTMFGIVHGATRSLPVEQPGDVVALEKTAAGSQADLAVRASDYAAWAAARSTVEGLAAYRQDSVNVSGDAREPERLAATNVTPNAFDVLGARPQLGRTFSAGDAGVGAAPGVIISDRLWTRRFDRSPDVIGRTLQLNGVPHTILGVMGPRFGFPVNSSLWLPLAISAGAAPGSGERVDVFVRVRPGTPIRQAEAELAGLTPPAPPRAATGVHLFPFTEIETPKDVIRALYVMVVAASFVLLIACSNVANLLLARAAVRRRDVAVRMALGASRRHIVVSQLLESLMLSGAGCLLGIGLAAVGTRLFAVNTANIIEAYWVDIRVDAAVVAFASGLAIAATTLAGLAPALRSARATISEALAGTGRSSLRLGRVGRNLVAVQVTLAGGLLALTMILGQTSVRLRGVVWPYDPHAIATAELGVAGSVLDDPAARTVALDRIAAAVRALPGVADAAFVSALPGRGSGNWSFSLDAATDRPSMATGVTMATPGFLSVLDGQVLHGRSLQARDDQNAPPLAVVNRSFVGRFSPDRDPVGRRIFLGTKSFTIIGIVPDLMAGDVQDRRQDGVYIPMAQLRPVAVRLMARGAAAATLLPEVRRAIRAVDPDLPVFELMPLYDAVFQDKRVLDVLSLLFLTFGAGALALTAVGLYSVLSFGVAMRSREIGIRVALGARRLQVVALVARDGAAQVAIGLAGAAGFAILISRVFASAVEQVNPASGRVIAGIVGAIFVTSLLALVGPARRASRAGIAACLRSE